MNYNPYRVTLQDFIATNFWEFMGLMGILIVGAFFVGIIWNKLGKLRYDFEELKTSNSDEHKEMVGEVKEVKDGLEEATEDRAEIKSDVKLIKHIVLNGRNEEEIAAYTAIK